MRQIPKEELAKIRIAAKLGDDRDIQEAVSKALEVANVGRKWQEDVDEWAGERKAYFSVRSCYEELGAVTPKDKGAIRQALFQLTKQGTLERSAIKDGYYRRKESTLIEMDWKNASLDPIKVKLTLGIEELVNLYPADLVVLAGEGNTGKTAACFDIIEQNMNEWKCHYFSSELGSPKVKKRLSLHEIPLEDWKFAVYDRHDNYGDVVFKDDLNFIDFVMVTDDFWKVGGTIKDIHLAMRGGKGLAIICLQKDPHKEFGRGGAMTQDLASLYVTLLRPGTAKIVKVKDWNGESNPNEKICRFKLIKGAKFIPQTPWEYAENLEPIEKKLPWEKRR